MPHLPLLLGDSDPGRRSCQMNLIRASHFSGDFTNLSSNRPPAAYYRLQGKSKTEENKRK
jgi:hypothetical protein